MLRNRKLRKSEKIMPGGDGTGPSGQGPMTGRRLGYCANNGQTVFNRPLWGYGRMGMGYNFGRGRGGIGRGGGMGYRSGPYHPSAFYGPAPTKEQVVANLNLFKESLKRQLDELTEEIERLNATDE